MDKREEIEPQRHKGHEEHKGILRKKRKKTKKRLNHKNTK
jgi:hypothetical protein